MNHRSFLLLLLLLLTFTATAMAGLATDQEMDQVCENWLIQTVYEQGSWSGTASPIISDTREITNGTVILARCYNISPCGFVIVPTLKGLPPVKAYSDESILDDRQQEGFLALIQETLESKYDIYERLHGSLDAEAVDANWNRLTASSKDFQAALAQKSTADVRSGGPLLTSSWNQGSPYNDYCPMGNGSRCVVGCVATATAQVLNYWQYPETGIGSHSFDWSGDRCDPGFNAQTLTADYTNPLDWASMADSCDMGCSPAAEAALAELNYEVGVAFNMSYGSCGSAANTARGLIVYPTFYKYSQEIEIADRGDYNLAEWYGVMQTEIDAGRVGQYRINSHSIVMDGYRESSGQYQYHLNYGWAGSFTAWFTLDSLYCSWVLPDSICPPDEEFVIINIKPETLPSLVYKIHAFEETTGDGDGHADPGEQFSVSVTIANSGAPTTNIVGTLISLDANLTIVTGSADYDNSVAWTETTETVSPFIVSVDAGCPDPYVALLEHTVSCDGGDPDVDTFQVFIGDTEGFADLMESGAGNWRHYPMTDYYEDQWHLETYRSYSGSTSWKAGGLGGTLHVNNLNATLNTPPFLLPSQAELTFWHWIDAEIDEATTAYDGSTIWIGTPDGAWTQLEPENGYTHTFVASSEPPGAGCWSGTYDWRQETVDLSAYSGVVQIRFLFYSDGGVTEEGWYVDDVEIAGGGCCVGIRGNINNDPAQQIDISDLVFLVSFMFSEGPPSPCAEEADINGSGGLPDISDLVYLVTYMFQSGPAPADCP